MEFSELTTSCITVGGNQVAVGTPLSGRSTKGGSLFSAAKALIAPVPLFPLLALTWRAGRILASLSRCLGPYWLLERPPLRVALVRCTSLMLHLSLSATRSWIRSWGWRLLWPHRSLLRNQPSFCWGPFLFVRQRCRVPVPAWSDELPTLCLRPRDLQHHRAWSGRHRNLHQWLSFHFSAYKVLQCHWVLVLKDPQSMHW